MIINVQSYGDFDIPVTQCLMEIDGFGKREMKEILNSLEERFSHTNDPDGVIKELKRWGAVHLKSCDITIGGNK